MQGQDEKDVDLLGTGHREKASFPLKEQALLDYVKVLTLTPSKVKDSDVDKLRGVGWNDNEIFEASFITSLFAFFNRMADAYGLDYDPARWMPPERRPPPNPADSKLLEAKPKK